MRLLAAGVTVARTADDLVRYHGKYMIVDRKELYLLAFNFTYLDIEHSRSFGLITSQRKVCTGGIKLFEADTKRQPYTPGLSRLSLSARSMRASSSQHSSRAPKRNCSFTIRRSATPACFGSCKSDPRPASRSASSAA